MHSFRHVLIPVLILAGGIGGYFLLSTWKSAPARVPPSVQPPLVETQPSLKFSGSFPIRVHGEAVPSREIRISAEVAGRIVKKSPQLESGRFISDSSWLITIDREPYQLELEKLDQEAKQVELAQRRLKSRTGLLTQQVTLSKRRLKLASDEFQRVSDLYEKGTATNAERDSAEQNVLQIETSLRELQNQQADLPIQTEELQTQARLIETRKQLAQLNLDRTEIRATVDGIVTADLQEVGHYVEPGDHLLTVRDSSALEIACRLRGEELIWLRDSVISEEAGLQRSQLELPERPATIRHRVGGETFSWNGTLVRSDGAGFDTTTRTLAGRVVVDPSQHENPSTIPSLVEGMFVEVEISVAPSAELVAIPRSALQPDGTVWTVDNSKLRIHSVRPVRVTSTSVLLKVDQVDFPIGEQVVTTSLPVAFDGMEIRERPSP